MILLFAFTAASLAVPRREGERVSPATPTRHQAYRASFDDTKIRRRFNIRICRAVAASPLASDRVDATFWMNFFKCFATTRYSRESRRRVCIFEHAKRARARSRASTPRSAPASGIRVRRTQQHRPDRAGACRPSAASLADAPGPPHGAGAESHGFVRSAGRSADSRRGTPTLGSSSTVSADIEWDGRFPRAGIQPARLELKASVRRTN